MNATSSDTSRKAVRTIRAEASYTIVTKQVRSFSSAVTGRPEKATKLNPQLTDDGHS